MFSAVAQTVCKYLKGNCSTVALITQAFRKPREGFFFSFSLFLAPALFSSPSSVSLQSPLRSDCCSTTAMLLFTLMSLSVSLVKADQERPPALGEIVGEHMALGQVTLNEMFKEVEKLMEDTQQKLEEAVHQVGHRASHSHCSQDKRDFVHFWLRRWINEVTEVLI